MATVSFTTRSGRQVNRPSFLREEFSSSLPNSPRQSRSRADPALSPQRRFLSTLYSEIQSSASAVASSQPVPQLTEVQKLLRIARTTRFVNSVRKLKTTQFPDLQNRNQATQRLLATLVTDARSRDSLQSLRLDECVSSFGYHVLSICLHSDEFRKALVAEDVEKALTWNQRLLEISKRSASLELFARTRELDYVTPIAHSDQHFQNFLNNNVKELRGIIPKATTGENLGIKRGEFKAKHQIDDQDRNFATWQLQADPESSATRPCITYVNTDQLKRELPDTKGVSQFKDQVQVDIPESIVLPKYRWPRKRYWPEADPRYAGFEEDWCVCCKKSRDLIPKTRNNNDDPYQRCVCTLDVVSGYGGTPNVELFATERTGTGVRALQHIKQYQILDAYLGEIYPAHKKDKCDAVPARYGPGIGGGYRVEVAITKRHPRHPKKGEARDSKRIAEDLHEDEYTHFVIDSALRGNWTRYINHSCDHNTVLRTRNVGMRSTVLIEASRSIQFGEEITVDYGDDYFPIQGHGCKCGAPTCLRWNENDLEYNDITLEQAILAKIAPSWAATEKGRARPGIAFPINDGALYTKAKNRAARNKKAREAAEKVTKAQAAKSVTKGSIEATKKTASKVVSRHTSTQDSKTARKTAAPKLASESTSSSDGGSGPGKSVQLSPAKKKRRLK